MFVKLVSYSALSLLAGSSSSLRSQPQQYLMDWWIFPDCHSFFISFIFFFSFHNMPCFLLGRNINRVHFKWYIKNILDITHPPATPTHPCVNQISTSIVTQVYFPKNSTMRDLRDHHTAIVNDEFSGCAQGECCIKWINCLWLGSCCHPPGFKTPKTACKIRFWCGNRLLHKTTGNEEQSRMLVKGYQWIYILPDAAIKLQLSCLKTYLNAKGKYMLLNSYLDTWWLDSKRS